MIYVSLRAKAKQSSSNTLDGHVAAAPRHDDLGNR